jgi:hypothetical protein
LRSEEVTSEANGQSKKIQARDQQNLQKPDGNYGYAFARIAEQTNK